MRKIVLLILPVLCCNIGVVASPADSVSINAGVPLSLDSALSIGLKNNPAIKSSQLKIKAAHGRILTAVSPTPLEISASFDNIPEKQTIDSYGENSIGVSQSIEFPANYVVRGKKYRKELDILQQDFVQIKLDVRTRIKTAYFNVLALKSQVDISKENLQIAEQFLKKAEIRYSIGEGTNLEKLTAKVQYTEALNNLEVQKNHYSTAVNELNFAMGNDKSKDRNYQLVDSLVFTSHNLSVENLLEQASLNNPALRSGKLQVDVSLSEKKLSLSSLLPDISVGAYSKCVTEDKKRYYGVSLGVTIPLWCMLDQNGKIKEASANVAAAQADLEGTENSIRLQIKSAYNEFKDTQRQLIYYRDAIQPQAEEVYRSASKSYQSGEITYIEFLEAQKTVIDARSNYVDALLAYNLSIVSLEQFIGTTIQ